MHKSGIQNFTATLKEILDDPWDLPETNDYIRLDTIGEVCPDHLLRDNSLPPADPLVDAFNIIIEQAQNLFVDNITLGMNEILKAYLKKINPGNQSLLTSRVIEYVHLIFLFITKESFPYTEKIWEDMSAMAKPVGICLIRNNLTQASLLFFEFLAGLGKQAARTGLSTGTLQHGFRVWELNARDCSCTEVESLVRNLRQNLEN
ncbi:hypothetical protein [Candidatus Formimonas warabiya]|uniref:Uncharacterized protein n=1 Tax=Formimonas warabiya TaxID=1761012 RepID=A0A3G1KM26_FORW1|nr:hypothetical protein [Candidatus Formimonas warabiya]ATW23493.1 hypothetical protein DCMF_00600 [Candidatus Formimonas warabiya]